MKEQATAIALVALWILGWGVGGLADRCRPHRRRHLRPRRRPGGDPDHLRAVEPAVGRRRPEVVAPKGRRWFRRRNSL